MTHFLFYGYKYYNYVMLKYFVNSIGHKKTRTRQFFTSSSQVGSKVFDQSVN